MSVVNLTPHTVNIVDESNVIVASYPSAGIARVNTIKQIVGEIDGVAVKAVSYGEIDGLPEPDGETIYIVSMVVASAVFGRDDVVSPDTAPDSTVRDASGQIIGVRNFARY